MLQKNLQLEICKQSDKVCVTVLFRKSLNYQPVQFYKHLLVPMNTHDVGLVNVL